MNTREKMFKCFSLDYLNQKEDLDRRANVMNTKDFLKCDLSIFSEKEIVTVLISNETFGEYEKELIRVWATILKSKKLFEIADGSKLIDIEFNTKLKEFSCSGQFVEGISGIDWEYVDFELNGGITNVKGFYEEVAMNMAINDSLTVELIEEFDLRGVDWNYKDNSGRSLLVYICSYKYCSLDIDLLICLLDKEIDINNTDHHRRTAFMELCRKSEITLDMLELFFDRGVDMNAKDDNKSTTFMDLCCNPYVTLGMLELFFDRGVDMNAKDNNKRTAFMELCRNPAVTLDMIKLFFDNGVDMEEEDCNGTTAFAFLCYNESITLDMLKLFFDKGVDIYKYDDKIGSYFEDLCENESLTLDMIKLFFDKFAVNIQNKHVVISFRELCCNPAITLDMVKLFLENGASLNVFDVFDGKIFKPLDYYIKCGGRNEEILKLLRQG